MATEKYDLKDKRLCGPHEAWPVLVGHLSVINYFGIIKNSVFILRFRRVKHKL